MNIALVRILTTTKFAIQNGINQSCRINTFWFMDDYVTKFEKRCCMLLALEDLLSKDTYYSKDGWLWVYLLSFEYSNDFLYEFSLSNFYIIHQNYF